MKFFILKDSEDGKVDAVIYSEDDIQEFELQFAVDKAVSSEEFQDNGIKAIPEFLPEGCTLVDRWSDELGTILY